MDDAALPRGTTLAVADLFFNTPARRKFLRAESTELAHITALVTHYALVHPEMRFELVSATHTVLSAPPVERTAERVYQLFGKETLAHLLPLAAAEVPHVGEIGAVVAAEQNECTGKWVHCEAGVLARGRRQDAARHLRPGGAIPLPHIVRVDLHLIVGGVGVDADSAEDECVAGLRIDDGRGTVAHAGSRGRFDLEPARPVERPHVAEAGEPVVGGEAPEAAVEYGFLQGWVPPHRSEGSERRRILFHLRPGGSIEQPCLVEIRGDAVIPTEEDGLLQRLVVRQSGEAVLWRRGLRNINCCPRRTVEVVRRAVLAQTRRRTASAGRWMASGCRRQRGLPIRR